MRILHVIATLDPAAGGPIEGVRTLFTYRKEGFMGEAVTLDTPDAPYLQGLPFPVYALGPRTSTYGYNKRLLPWLKANRHRYDGVIVNGLWQYMGLATMLAMKGHVPYMVFSHGMLDPYFKKRYPLKHLKKSLYWYPFEYWVLRRAYRLLFTTKTEQDLARQSFPLWHWASHIVPYGIRAPQGDANADVAAFLEAFPAIAGKRYLVFLGRIHPKKGCDLLLQAFTQLAADDPALHLVMAGPDETGWTAKLQAAVTAAGLEDRVHWTGILRGPEKWGAFRAAEAFILPSHQENFGIAVAEALAAGKPVLLSDKVNIGDGIRNEGCILVEPDTLDGTRSLLRRWIAMSGSEKQQMSAAASRCFETRFNMLETAQTILGLFQQARDEGAR